MANEAAARRRVARLARAALARNPAACFALAVRYHRGQGVERNGAVARALFERAAALGHPGAALALERLWSGVAPPPPACPPRDVERASADPECPAPEVPEALPEPPGEETPDPADVFYAAGWALASGSGVAQDWEKAAAWYRKAADLGHVLAQVALGNCLREGRGVARDAGGCVRLYTRAAERGFADAQCNLGWCYGTGFGVPRNYSSALRWYGKATALGHALAEHNFDVALREFDAQLSRRALPLEYEALRIAPDGTLEFNGRKCCLYIPRQHRELVNLTRRESSYTYHLCACRSMEDMLGTARGDLYAATSRADGRFEVAVLEREGARTPMSWRPYDIRIELCGNCRSMLLACGLYAEPFSLREFYDRVQPPLRPLEGEAVQRPVTRSYPPPVAVALPPELMEDGTASGGGGVS